jgi:lysophospholipase L1-like esterase
MAEGLGSKVEVVTDGLRGRTTGYDEYLADCDRNGVRTLPTVLYSHTPLDLVILLLGSNDMKPHIAGTAIAAMQGMRRLVSIVQNHVGGPGFMPAQVLVVSPPPLCETDDRFFGDMFEGGIEQSRQLAGYYRQIAEEQGCGFFDAAGVAETSPVDGIHLDAENTIRLGEALVQIAGDMVK